MSPASLLAFSVFQPQNVLYALVVSTLINFKENVLNATKTVAHVSVQKRPNATVARNKVPDYLKTILVRVNVLWVSTFHNQEFACNVIQGV